MKAVVWAGVLLIATLIQGSAFGYVRTMEGDITIDLSFDPPSGRYIDLATHAVYSYDAASGVLTPTLEVGNIQEFICVDAYTNTSACAVATGADAPCQDSATCTTSCTGYQACTAAAIAVVGLHKLKAVSTANIPCGDPKVGDATNDKWLTTRSGSGTVSYLRTYARFGNLCGPGTVDVEAFVNGASRDSDSTPYE